jgi:general secretion pathway protein A
LEEDSYRLALIFNPRLTPIGLLQSINTEFGLTGRRRSLVGLIQELNQFLLEENAAGRTPVLIVDEAQNLSPEVLEQIRLLSNLETERDKLIQIVLVGQPELGEMLARPNLRQLNQRIVVRCRLDPLDDDETTAYVLHRLRVAGRGDGALFLPEALREVHRRSAGFPRLINIICDRALLVTYTEGERQVSPRDVRQAAREIAGEEGTSWRQALLRGGLLAWLGRLMRSARRVSF